MPRIRREILAFFPHILGGEEFFLEARSFEWHASSISGSAGLRKHKSPLCGDLQSYEMTCHFEAFGSMLRIRTIAQRHASTAVLDPESASSSVTCSRMRRAVFSLLHLSLTDFDTSATISAPLRPASSPTRSPSHVMVWVSCGIYDLDSFSDFSRHHTVDETLLQALGRANSNDCRGTNR